MPVAKRKELLKFFDEDVKEGRNKIPELATRKFNKSPEEIIRYSGNKFIL